MKKQVLRAFLVLTVLGFAASASATTSITGATTIGSAANTFTPSAKVGISISSSATSYAAAACHVNGTFEYGTIGGTNLSGSFTDTSKIYKKDIPTQSGTVGAPTAQTSATSLSGTGWE